MKKCLGCDCLIADNQKYCYRCAEKSEQTLPDRKKRKELRKKIKKERMERDVEYDD